MFVMPVVSIIIPVYNAEEYIEECISSILNQTFQGFEAIFVNDASTDHSVQIIERFSLKDNRIKVLHMPIQSGQGLARNEGMKYAAGEYIYFVDADDYIELDTLEVCLKQIQSENADIIEFGCDRHIIGKGTADFYLPSYEAGDGRGITTRTRCSVCNKMFKHSFLKEYALQFRSIYSEDVFFVYECIHKEPKYSILSRILYHWRYNEKSTTLVPLNKAKVEDMITLLEWMQCNVEGDYETKEKNFMRWVRCMVNRFLYSLSICKDSEYEEQLLQWVRERGRQESIAVALVFLQEFNKSKLSTYMREWEWIATKIDGGQLLQGSNVILYGAGKRGIRLLHALKITSIQVISFVDISAEKQKETVFGLPVLSPNQLKDRKVDKVIVTPLEYKEIKKTLNKMGLEYQKDYLIYGDGLEAI